MTVFTTGVNGRAMPFRNANRNDGTNPSIVNYKTTTMASIGKKILSAFVEVTEAKPPVTKPEEADTISTDRKANTPPPPDSDRFMQYFEKLFTEANIQGPDYYEFSKMIEAMGGIADEKARYSAAFAGLQVQGLNRQKLLSTASDYLGVLDKDAGNFLSTVDATLHEKVHGKRKEMEQKQERIKQLSQEINELHQQVDRLNDEVKENEQKIEQSTGGYKAAMEMMKSRIQTDMEKIKTFIQ
jgi:uncharacterized protein YoxC